MRNQLMGGGVLAAGLLLVLGLVFVSGQGSVPAVHAQTTCDDDEAHCLVITKQTDPADDDQDFAFNNGAFEISDGESEAFSVESTGSLTVTEDEVDGWTLSAISCDDDEFVEIDEAGGSVTVDFAEFDEEEELVTVSCTFLNEIDETPTATTTATATTEATSTSTTTPAATSAAGTPVVPTPIAPTPAPPASQVESGTISPPTTGSAGLK